MEPRGTLALQNLVGALCATLFLASPALAQRGATLDIPAAISLGATRATASVGSLQDPALDTSAHLRYAQEGSHWGAFGAGMTASKAGNGDHATGFNTTFSYTYFMIDGVEISGELGGWYYAQTGDNAYAVNPCAVLRWHFWRSEEARTTVYFDAGIGMLLSNDNIPQDGTSFNFTPRFGFGLTHQITDSGWRLQTGLRWNHVSNARIKGDINNPSRDGPLLYFGVIFPF